MDPGDMKTPLNLKRLLAELGINQEELAERITQRSGRRAGQRLSRSAVTRILNEGWRPSETPWEEVVTTTEALLAERGATPGQIASCWLPAEEESHRRLTSLKPPRKWKPSDDYAQEQNKEMLTTATKRHFGLFQDPFINDVTSGEDIFMDDDIRQIREAMFQAAKQGGWMMAVVGESGSGKTTLRRETIDRIRKDGLPVVVCMPQSFDKSALTARHISRAILADVRPHEKARLDLEALSRQVINALVESSRAGNTHVLFIEEAHDLAIPTLKYLKRFWEMEDGHRKLLSIVLLGQPELKLRLNERQYSEAREVIRRMEIAELLPLDENTAGYLAMKFRRVGKEAGEIMEEGTVGALRERLTLRDRGGGRNETISLCYPLVVNNWITRAMNEAARLGASRVTADIVRGLQS